MPRSLALRTLPGSLAALAVLGLVAAPGTAGAAPVCDIVHKKCYDLKGPPKVDPDFMNNLKKKPPFVVSKNNDPGFSKPGFGGGKGHGGWGGPGWGYGAAALAGGLALGAMAAGAASAGGDCYFERRRVEDEDGNVYIRRVRVCE